MVMQVDNYPIENVKQYENNPRKNDDAVEYVANSIREFGFQQPLVVDSDGVLIVGHTRLKAAQKLGLAEVPVVVADGLTEEQVKAYRLADNKTSEKAFWDLSKLDKELEDIDWLEFDMEQFGFFIEEDESKIEEKELKPYAKAHYLISCDIEQVSSLAPLIEEIAIKGYEVVSSLNGTKNAD